MPQRDSKWIRENTKKLIVKSTGQSVERTLTRTFYEAREAEIAHGTYMFEQQMLEYIRQGNPIGLEKHLLEFMNFGSYYEGDVAANELRQVKNIFVSLVAMAGKMAAIPGGMPIEQAYYLIDTYSQQCEELQTIDSIYTLQFNMLIDFAERVSRYKFPNTLSPLIRDCINYIILHLNEPIRSSDVIAYSGMSRSFLSEKFKQETGSEIGAFITRSKIDEAKSLLRYTDRSISEIASYLSFSSQPYFQNVFRRESGMTPLQYRNQKS